jgi:riboflavin synthase
MFTGLIERTGQLAESKTTPGGQRVRIGTALGSELAPGDSVAVNGVCLTVATCDAEGFHADIGPETARVTTLAALRRGSVLNLERPLRPDSRLGGHFVQGHVDAVGRIDEIRQEGESYWITVSYPRELAALLIRKGSIAVDGISLTVAGLDERLFDVQVIPFTWGHTNLSAASPGDHVNLEFDMLGKYVARAVELAQQAAGAQ